MTKLIVLILFFTSTQASALPSDKCLRWFSEEKINPGPNCLNRCAILPVDMGTFSCPNECPELCKISGTEEFLFNLSDLYPGLTGEERALAAQNPKQVLKAYLLSHKAESVCRETYLSSRTNDESDACRHYVWAALMNKELGKSISDKILNAHEQVATQPENEKAMDLANNRRGLIVSDELIKSKKISEQTIVERFKEDLKTGRIIVLKKGAR